MRAAAPQPRAPYLLVLSFLLVVGCSSPADDGAAPTASPGATTPTSAASEPTTPAPAPAPEDPLATTFKVQDSLATATEAEKFADVNPFGYHNPLRSS